MPNINDIFPSTYLKAYDLKGHTPIVTIDRVEFAQVRGGRTGTTETKPIVYFRGKAKGLLLNKTNAKAIMAIAGSAQTEAWTGVAVTLYATTDTFGADKHDVIRIKAAATMTAAERRASAIPSSSTPRPTPATAAIFADDLEIDLADGKGQAY